MIGGVEAGGWVVESPVTPGHANALDIGGRVLSLYERLIWGSEIRELPKLQPLIEGVLDLQSTAILFGGSGFGKSVTALDWALSISSGTAWDGHRVRKGRVLYIVGEGLYGTNDRYDAWCEHHGQQPVENIAFSTEAPNILDARARLDLMECVKKAEPILTILDTVARHIPGGDENSFETMSRVVDVLDQIKVETGGCALGVHHTGKDETAGSRGHSSLKGAIDTEIHCARGPMLTVTKQKNHADGHLLGSYELLAVNGSVVLNPKTRRSTPNDDMAIRALGDLGGEATYSEWREAALALGMAPGSFDRTIKRLADLPMVRRDGTDGEVVWKLPSV